MYPSLRHVPNGDGKHIPFLCSRQTPNRPSRPHRIRPLAKEVLKYLTVRKMVSNLCRDTADTRCCCHRIAKKSWILVEWVDGLTFVWMCIRVQVLTFDTGSLSTNHDSYPQIHYEPPLSAPSDGRRCSPSVTAERLQD